MTLTERADKRAQRRHSAYYAAGRQNEPTTYRLYVEAERLYDRLMVRVEAGPLDPRSRPERAYDQRITESELRALDGNR
jgi:hypothetical protein